MCGSPKCKVKWYIILYQINTLLCPGCKFSRAELKVLCGPSSEGYSLLVENGVVSRSAVLQFLLLLPLSATAFCCLLWVLWLGKLFLHFLDLWNIHITRLLCTIDVILNFWINKEDYNSENWNQRQSEYSAFLGLSAIRNLFLTSSLMPSPSPLFHPDPSYISFLLVS